jgi:uncharacterized membrane protein/thiol-disulfide isomerase/thioredoxin
MNMWKSFRILSIAVAASILIPLGVRGASAQDALPVVHAVLFYSPTCPHCQYVIAETLPPLYARYGDQLEVLGVDVSQPDGQLLFLRALDQFGLQQGGVPFLVIDHIHLIGSVDIPEQFPILVDHYLSQGGVDWPTLPGLPEMLAEWNTSVPQHPADNVIEAPEVQPQAAPITWRDRFAADPAGNTASVVVLAVMLAALASGGIVLAGRASTRLAKPASWIVPVLCLLGMGVAAYLAYVETAQVAAVCGPVGDCNTVQQSEYARLFGVLPIGVLGLAGYAVIIVAWAAARWAPIHISRPASLALVAMTLGGTLFSLYLTFLEPFVIGATCAWCLTSSMAMTVLMLLTVRPLSQLLSSGASTRRRGRSRSPARRSF